MKIVDRIRIAQKLLINDFVPSAFYELAAKYNWQIKAQNVGTPDLGEIQNTLSQQIADKMPDLGTMSKDEILAWLDQAIEKSGGHTSDAIKKKIRYIAKGLSLPKLLMYLSNLMLAGMGQKVYEPSREKEPGLPMGKKTKPGEKPPYPEAQINAVRDALTALKTFNAKELANYSGVPFPNVVEILRYLGIYKEKRKAQFISLKDAFPDNVMSVFVTDLNSDKDVLVGEILPTYDGKFLYQSFYDGLDSGLADSKQEAEIILKNHAQKLMEQFYSESNPGYFLAKKSFQLAAEIIEKYADELPDWLEPSSVGTQKTEQYGDIPVGSVVDSIVKDQSSANSFVNKFSNKTMSWFKELLHQLKSEHRGIAAELIEGALEKIPVKGNVNMNNVDIKAIVRQLKKEAQSDDICNLGIPYIKLEYQDKEAQGIGTDFPRGMEIENKVKNHNDAVNFVMKYLDKSKKWWDEFYQKLRSEGREEVADLIEEAAGDKLEVISVLLRKISCQLNN